MTENREVCYVQYLKHHYGIMVKIVTNGRSKERPTQWVLQWVKLDADGDFVVMSPTAVLLKTVDHSVLTLQHSTDIPSPIVFIWGAWRQITTAPKSQRVYHKTLGSVFSCLFVFPFNFACRVFVGLRFRVICGLRLWILFWSSCFMVLCNSLFVVWNFWYLDVLSGWSLTQNVMS